MKIAFAFAEMQQVLGATGLSCANVNAAHKMPALMVLILSGVLASAVLADDRDLITAQMQELADAVAPGDVAAWDKYLDANVIYAEEDDSYKGKAAILKEIVPLPNGVKGTIKIQLLSYHEDGDVAVALFRQHETEDYHGQLLHAAYLTSTTWNKQADGWKLIAAQVLAEKTDPPAIKLAANRLAQYVGTYKLKDSDAIYRISLTHGQLIGTRNGHNPAVWNAEAPDVFFVTGDPRIRKIFQRDASGQIVGFVERRESWDIVWVTEKGGRRARPAR